MPADIDDPRLTAYALNELSPAEREDVDALLRDDESARRIVEEVRAAANLLASDRDRLDRRAPHQKVAATHLEPLE